ncbi:MAG: DUF5615 family PIN-like protein [Gemmatimonadota bacterium]
MFLLDENISHKIAKALSALGEAVRHVTDVLPRGTADEAIFEKLAEEDWFLITQDQYIRRRKHQREAMLQAGIGAFIFTGRAEKSLKEMTVAVLERFDEINELAIRTDRPFIFGIPDRGGIERLE